MHMIRALFTLPLLFVNGLCSSGDDEASLPLTGLKSPKNPVPFIVQGDVAAPGQFPHIVFIIMEKVNVDTGRYKSTVKCSGNILDENHVLTAGHCLKLDGDVTVGPRSRVIAGMINKGSQTGKLVQTRYFLKRNVCIHPSYWVHRSLPRFDISVLTLDEPLEWSDAVKPIQLASTSPVPGVQCQTAGWGQADWFGPPTDDLKFANLTILDKLTCKYAKEDNLCAAGSKEHGNSCLGDSGGPLLCDGKLAGVVSFVRDGCAISGDSYFSDVPKHMDWITNPRKSCHPSRPFKPLTR